MFIVTTVDTIEVTAAHEAQVGAATVRRALPRATRRTIGAWCFADHFGPVVVNENQGLDVGPHPHLGLQTVTWLRSGAVLHRDSLGTEQVIRPGQLNLMTAGHGVSHSEERTGSYRGPLEGIQLWIAQPDSTRNGPASFEHLDSLPVLEIDHSTATVLIGSFLGATSPAHVATAVNGADLVGADLNGADLIGADLIVRSETTLPLDSNFEHGLVVLAGAVKVNGIPLTPGHLGYIPVAHDEVTLQAINNEAAQVVLLGGEPFSERIRMWWNFVGRDRDDFIEAYGSWADDDGRFGTVASTMPRMMTTPPV